MIPNNKSSLNLSMHFGAFASTWSLHKLHIDQIRSEHHRQITIKAQLHRVFDLLTIKKKVELGSMQQKPTATKQEKEDCTVNKQSPLDLHYKRYSQFPCGSDHTIA